MDDPAHTEIAAKLEESIDIRFRAMQDAFDQQMRTMINMTRGKLDALTGAVRNLAAEAARCNALQNQVNVMQADLEAVRRRCPVCSAPPDKDRSSSTPPAP